MSTRLAVLILSLLALPSLALAASPEAVVEGARSLVLSETPSNNAYLAGTDVSVAANVPGDLTAAGGTLVVSAPVAGDALLTGARIGVHKAIGGDLRAVGGSITVDAPVAGDLMLAAGSITASTTALDTHLVGGNIHVLGSGGDVTVYGADVILAGDIAGDVTVAASDRVVVAEGTHIHGVFKYDAPQEVSVPASAHIDGGVAYTGSSSFLPTNEEAKRFAIAGASVFFIVRILAVLIAAGLLAGLFPVFAERIAERALGRSVRRFVLYGLLGFGLMVATPVFILLLVISFVGIGLALLLAAAYVLLLLLSYLYAGILAGNALSRGLFKKTAVTWRSALLGMLVLYLIGVIPGIGTFVVCVLASVAAGTMLSILYRFAFGRTDDGLDDFSLS